MSELHESQLFPPRIATERLPDHLAQGDVLTAFEADIIPKFRPRPIAYVITSNSCDLMNTEGTTFVSAIPAYPLQVWATVVIEQKRRRATKAGRAISRKDLEDALFGRLDSLVNYEDKRCFFIPPHASIEPGGAFGSLEQIFAVSMAHYPLLMANRIATLESPWKELLGFKMGHLFNRVAVPSIEKQASREWLEKAHSDAVTNWLKADITPP